MLNAGLVARALITTLPHELGEARNVSYTYNKVAELKVLEVMQIPPECLQIFQPLFRHIQLFIPGDTQTVLKTRIPSFKFEPLSIIWMECLDHGQLLSLVSKYQRKSEINLARKTFFQGLGFRAPLNILVSPLLAKGDGLILLHIKLTSATPPKLESPDTKRRAARDSSSMAVQNFMLGWLGSHQVLFNLPDSKSLINVNPLDILARPGHEPGAVTGQQGGRLSLNLSLTTVTYKL
ncbi:unnamed protein product [Timema podura]|uniref:Uncharacterized protein n=1 Tax=Timema podura TaxID=61482 RepID=A0ABN7NJY7_TIMPD|nr:unnamed protein product [Timema podura]